MVIVKISIGVVHNAVEKVMYMKQHVFLKSVMYIFPDVYFDVLLYYLIQKFISTDLDGVERRLNTK